MQLGDGHRTQGRFACPGNSGAAQPQPGTLSGTCTHYTCRLALSWRLPGAKLARSWRQPHAHLTAHFEGCSQNPDG